MSSTELELEVKLAAFVKATTSDRDASHGFEHMQSVASNCKKILDMGAYDDNTRRWALIVAWLHDIVDHKYGELVELTALLLQFLKELEEQYANELMMCINFVSFSKERKNGLNYYTSELPEMFHIVRNIVSDADKLEAIGLIGVERCMAYSRHKLNVTNEKQVMEHVWEHAQEKLLILLSDGYIKTPEGKKLAMEPHNDIIQWIATNLKCLYNDIDERVAKYKINC